MRAVTYRQCEDRSSRSETLWRAGFTTLERIERGRITHSIPYEHVHALRLVYAPKRDLPRCYKLEIRSAHGTVSLDNRHFAARRRIEMRSDDFSRLAAMVLRGVLLASPAATIRTGRTWTLWLAQIAAAFVCLPLMGVLIWFLPLKLFPVSFLWFVKLIVFLGLLALVSVFALRARPQRITVDGFLRMLPGEG